MDSFKGGVLFYPTKCPSKYIATSSFNPTYAASLPSISKSAALLHRAQRDPRTQCAELALPRGDDSHNPFRTSGIPPGLLGSYLIRRLPLGNYLKQRLNMENFALAAAGTLLLQLCVE